MANIIVGHRGMAGSYPENTQVSVQAAIDAGVKWVEVDVQPTKDGILVVSHDHTLERCSNGHGRIDSYTLAELQQLDFGAWFNSKFAGEPIMTLETLLNLAARHQLSLNIEVKVDGHDVASVAQTLKQQLDSSPLGAEKIMLSSFSHPIIALLYQHCPGYRLGVLTEALSDADLQLLKQVNAFSCNLNYESLTAGQITTLRRHGYQIWCYTVNNKQDFPLLEQVDAIFTDWPQRFVAQV